MVLEQVLGLLQDPSEKLLGANREVHFHVVDLHARQDEHFARLDALDAEVALVGGPEAVLLEAELVRLSVLIVNQCGRVDHNVLRPEVLLHRDSILELLDPIACREHNRIDDGKHLVLHVRHDEGANTSDCEVKAVDRVALLVKIGRLRVHLLLEPRADPSNEVAIDVNFLEDLEVFEALLVDLFTDLESQVQWQRLDEVVQALVVRLRVVLERLANVVVEMRGDVVLLLELAEVEKLFLERCLLVIVVGQDRAERARDEREGGDTGEHEDDAEDALDRRGGRQVAVAHR